MNCCWVRPVPWSPACSTKADHSLPAEAGANQLSAPWLLRLELESSSSGLLLAACSSSARTVEVTRLRISTLHNRHPTVSGF